MLTTWTRPGVKGLTTYLVPSRVQSAVAVTHNAGRQKLKLVMNIEQVSCSSQHNMCITQLTQH